MSSLPFTTLQLRVYPNFSPASFKYTTDWFQTRINETWILKHGNRSKQVISTPLLTTYWLWDILFMLLQEMCLLQKMQLVCLNVRAFPTGTIGNHFEIQCRGKMQLNKGWHKLISVSDWSPVHFINNSVWYSSKHLLTVNSNGIRNPLLQHTENYNHSHKL